MAQNRVPTPAGTASILGALCTLHGIAPALYTHAWKDHKGVLISSCAEGWMAWTLGAGWASRSRYIGDPAELRPATPQTIAEARASGWIG